MDVAIKYGNLGSVEEVEKVIEAYLEIERDHPEISINLEVKEC